MKNLMKSLFSDSRGTETVEWGLIVGLIVGGLVLTVASIGAWVAGKFTQLDTELQSSNPAP